MRRRPPPAPLDGFPDELRRYRREQWTGRGCHPECAWRSALYAWIDDHPGESVGPLFNALNNASVPEHQRPPNTFYLEHI